MKHVKWFVLFTACSFVTLQADEIHDLVKSKDLKKIQELVRENPKVINSMDENGRTALYWACREDVLHIITFLIDHHADVNLSDRKNVSPLHLGAANGNRKACEILLNRNAQIDKTDSSGDTPLHYAVSYGQLEAVKCLIEKGASLEIENSRQRTPLIVAAREMAGIEIVRLLVESGANINARDYSNQTPVSLAAWRGSEEVVDYLLSRNAELDLTGLKGFQLLHYSINHQTS